MHIYMYIIIIILELSLVPKTVLYMPAHKRTEQYNVKRESMKDYKYFFYLVLSSTFFFLIY